MPRIVSSLSPAAVLACIALLAFASQTGAAHGRSGLSATHERWLEDVELLISKKERRTFLSLREDRHRDGFIAKFWEARDPDPKTPDNPFREQFLSRLKEARELYPEVDDRFQVHALNGPPSQEFEAICDEPIHSLVVWDYWHSEHVGGPLSLIFYRYPGGNWRILDPDSGPEILGVDPARLEGRNFVEVVESSCSAPTHIQVRITNSLQQYMRYSKSFIVPALSSPRNYDPEWLEAFLASSVEGVEPEVEPAREARRKPGGKYQEWLEEVRFLISRRERKAFLALEKDYQRDAFIRDFWEARDPDSSTPGNRFKDPYLARLEEAEERYVTPIDDRIRVFALNGDPSELYETSCGRLFWPLEFWIYNYSEHARSRLVLVLYQRFDTGPFRLWDPSEGYEALLVDPAAYARYRSDVTDRVENGEIGPSALRLATFHAYLERDCTESRQMIELIANTLEIYTTRGQSEILAATRRPENEAEWLPSFKAFSTELEPGRTKLDAELSFEFPGRHQQRTVVRGVFAVPESAAQVQELAGRRSYNFALTGEVLRAGELFESFKVVFDVPQPDAGSGSGGQALPLVFERWLRPGDYQLIVKLEDIIGGAAFREDRELTVPQRRGGGDAAQTDVPDFFGAPAEDTDLELRAEGKDFQRGYVRFSAQIEGGEV
ncbi:MAG: GWxTD domain-containing protein, partial [Thermoanaerobaculia bacterium]